MTYVGRCLSFESGVAPTPCPSPNVRGEDFFQENDITLSGSANEESRATQVAKEFGGFVGCFGVVFFATGMLFLTLMLIVNSDDFSNFFSLGLFFALLGFFLIFVAWQFRSFKRWSYPLVYILVATWWGLRGANISENRRKMRLPEVRKAFGPEPISNRQD
jgi:hypothetical protein